MSDVKLFSRTLRLIKVKKNVYWASLWISAALLLCIELLFAFCSRNFVIAIQNKDMSIFKITVLLSFLMIALRCVFILVDYFKTNSVRWIMLDIRRKLFAHMERLDVSYYEKHHSGDTISRLANDVEPLKTFFADNFFNLITSIVILIGNICAMMYLDFRLGIIMLLLVVVATYINVTVSKKIKSLSANIQKNLALLNQTISDILAGFRVLKIYSPHIIFDRFHQANDESGHLRMQRYKKTAELKSIDFIIYFCVNFGMILIGVVMTIKGLTSFANVIAILALQESVANILMGFGSYLASIRSKLAGAERVFEVFDTPAETENHETKNAIIPPQNDMITLTNVNFSYDTRENILSDVCMHVERGNTVALVGQSGSGKSTIIKILLGFYKIDSGSLFINKKPISEYTLSDLRKMFSYVPQEALLFEGSILENIGFGAPEADKSSIIEAAKVANAHEFIMKLADGYDTNVGARGENLSGGQRQRVAIARAVLKNAPILLLDEATSALDSENEALVQAGLDNLMNGRTVLVVAHRLSTIKNAERIYVLKNGKIVEEGNHDSLLEKKGIYSRLYQ